MEPEVIIMYSDKYQMDMWWIETGDDYIGPFASYEAAVKELATN